LPKEEKAERVNQIRGLLLPFCERYLDEELTGFVFNLFEKLRRKRTLSILRGRPEIRVAAIVYKITRLTFLFDKANAHNLTPEGICSFFGTKKSTTENAVSIIEKTCHIKMGESGFCRPEIAKMFVLVKDLFGFLYPFSYVRKQIEAQLTTNE